MWEDMVLNRSLYSPEIGDPVASFGVLYQKHGVFDMTHPEFLGSVSSTGKVPTPELSPDEAGKGSQELGDSRPKDG